MFNTGVRSMAAVRRVYTDEFESDLEAPPASSVNRCSKLLLLRSFTQDSNLTRNDEPVCYERFQRNGAFFAMPVQETGYRSCTAAKTTAITTRKNKIYSEAKVDLARATAEGDSRSFSPVPPPRRSKNVSVQQMNQILDDVKSEQTFSRVIRSVNPTNIDDCLPFSSCLLRLEDFYLACHSATVPAKLLIRSVIDLVLYHNELNKMLSETRFQELEEELRKIELDFRAQRS
ncbi:unnamed protein product [Soboliphyme baturini]|uniref:Uncharacterized protein n=1 Tax=Soboliphyme baturini TaxID=241478 RepID=A0A183J188_9BILA|nr:unnamed protein product [Soboliphyme baturini]